MIELKLTEEQAQIVAKACEFYARMKMGQFNEVVWHFLNARNADRYCQRRECAEYHLLEARKAIYPNLVGFGHSYGMGDFEDADKAYDVYQVIRFAFGGERPFSYHELPECRLLDED